MLTFSLQILLGAGKDVRGGCSQTALSKRCRRKASEKSSGSLTHTTRHQQGGGQCFKVDLGFCFYSYILHHTVWREYTIGLSFSFLFLSIFFIILIILPVLVCHFLFRCYRFILSPLWCIFRHLWKQVLLIFPLPSFSVTVFFFLALHYLHFILLYLYLLFSTFKWSCHIVTTSGHPH